MKKLHIAMQALLSAGLVVGGTVGSAGVADAATAEAVSSVSLRESPSTSSDRIRYVDEGERLVILSEPNDYWYKVRDEDGRVGYVSSSDEYVDIVDSSSADMRTSNASAPSAPVSPASASKLARRIIDAGKEYLGTPYEYGSSRSSTRTFDCSDFVRQAFKDGARIALPSNSRDQGDYVKERGETTTSWSKLKPGDLMFFMSYRGSSASDYKGLTKSKQRITHVSIYLGNGKMLHTYSKDSGGVRIDSIDNKHWEYRFIFGGSAL
ncbi:NlpC/P60 family protein [Paenibacillus antri]|uniref:NlpC/P60 family protein n=1 Tax=Paenibacillus antri TaxID=2582848 RepID=A0A5R9GKY4_9BACL|nr:SH3 domain-containing C40 family peptidase [Paenibacillus antri]TLS54198.1 NlpC/P60 family protein [Paenibacillus antri]